MTEQAAVIRWEDPPPARARAEHGQGWSRFTALADVLRANPGRWAVIGESPGQKHTALATHIRMGAIVCFTPAGDFDAVARRVGDLTAIYARYVGDCSDEENQ